MSLRSDAFPSVLASPRCSRTPSAGLHETAESATELTLQRSASWSRYEGSLGRGPGGKPRGAADNPAMKRISIIALLAVSVPVLAEINYCHDPETSVSWEQIKRNHRSERDVEALWAMRERLCREVDAGTITVREATERFEGERARVNEERREHNRRQETGGSGLG